MKSDWKYVHWLYAWVWRLPYTADTILPAGRCVCILQSDNLAYVGHHSFWMNFITYSRQYPSVYKTMSCQLNAMTLLVFRTQWIMTKCYLVTQDSLFRLGTYALAEIYSQLGKVVCCHHCHLLNLVSTFQKWPAIHCSQINLVLLQMFKDSQF